MPVKNARAEKSAPLRVCDWSRCFETSRTRRLAESLSWLRLPTQADSMGYLRFIDVAGTNAKDRLAMFGAWTALVKVAARCKPRGVLVRDLVIPLTPADIALKSSMGPDSVALFEEMIRRAKAVGWLISLTDEEMEQLRKGTYEEHPQEAEGEPQEGASPVLGAEGGHNKAVKGSVDGQGVDATGSHPGHTLVTTRSHPGHTLVNSAGSNGHLTREDFDSIWGLFPKSRRMDKAKCFDLCSAHVKAGRSVALLREATARYAAAVKDAETPPKYIQLAKTFYGASGRVLDAMEPDFAEQYVEGSKGEAKVSANFKPGTMWGVVYGEECKIVKQPRTGRLEYWSHNDWHELPSGIEIHKA